MPELTALRRAGEGRVALELDGRPWRVVPDDVVVRAGLAAGLDLDRPALRRLRGELRRAEARASAARALAQRDLSAGRLRERLARAGVRGAAAVEAIDVLERSGVVSDERLARARAQALAERGYGDAAIAARLEDDGVGREHAEAALAELLPESERASAFVRPEGDPARAARRLARRGFRRESIETALGGVLDWEASGGLRYVYAD
ncbi:MAG: RecX family transcriptional regulator [Thermoleophilia bacterium]|nr:RecX family transcriptional regulator [Thermoleophilia bacterium]